MSTDYTQIELTDQQRQMLASAAEQLGVPWPVVFEQAIGPLSQQRSERRTIESVTNGRGETPYEILTRHGLIGCVEGTPPDLSTNKKHMEGYGADG